MYDDRLRQQEGFKQSVTTQWKQYDINGNISLAHKLQKSRSHISRWKRMHCFNAKERISTLRHQLDISCTDGHPVPVKKQLHTELHKPTMMKKTTGKEKVETHGFEQETVIRSSFILSQNQGESETE